MCGGYAYRTMFGVPNKQPPSGRILTTQGTDLLLCAGKDCFRKEKKAFKNLEDSAGNAGLQLHKIKCQGTCEGPTAVVPTPCGPRWFEALDCPKLQTDLVSFATGAEAPSRRLTKRELTGKRKKKAAKKLSSQLS